jgi:hypothetical protein
MRADFGRGPTRALTALPTATRSWTPVRYGLAVLKVSRVVSMALAASQELIATEDANSGVVVVLFLTVLGILAGIGAGRRKAFMLKLQAQQLLCQRQTEINTRK